MWRKSPRMDSNSTLAPNQHSSSWKGERRCVKEDHFAMATYSDSLLESDHCIAYPAFPRPRLRIDSRIAALPERETLTMLYVPPAAAASNVTRLPVPTSTSRNTPTNIRIPSPVHTTQEAPPPRLDT